ncbi:MAG: DUF58 domain-containing protein [Gammaproteobacteria bacterium]|nr:DUF58 domain-containing protein [Gammaproteobacteria bacterium]
MPAVTAAPHALLHKLRHFQQRLRPYLPDFLLSHEPDVNGPLLDRTEILDLQLRVAAKSTPPSPAQDTAEQRRGDRRSIYRGDGLDYEESRPYQPGDDPRHLNWKLSARSGELYMKVFREERRPGIVVLLDRRRSMQFGTQTRLKITQAARLATCIAFAAQQQHAALDAIVLESTRQAPRRIRDSNDKQAADSLIRAACAPCPPDNNAAADSSAADSDAAAFDAALSLLQQTHVAGSSLYLLSDFMDLGEHHRARLMQLSAHNDVHAVHLYDPAEQRLPQAGRLLFHGAQDAPEMSVDTMDPVLRAAYEAAAAKHFAARKQLFDSLNIRYTAISTTEDHVEDRLSAL